MLKKFTNIILQRQIKSLVLSLHYNGDNSYLFANGREELKFKTKNNEIQKNYCVLEIYLQTGVQLNQQKQDYVEMLMTLL